MAHQAPSRVRERSITTGVGSYTLLGAALSYRTFAAAMADGDTVDCVVVMAGNYELGRYTYSAGTLARTAVLKSSNGDAAVDWPPGTKDIAAASIGLTDLDATGLANFVLLLGMVGAINSPNAGEYARFTGAGTIEGRTAAEARADLDLEPGTDFYSIAAADAAFQPKDTDLTALAALASTGGMVARTGAGTFAVRTITGTAAQIAVANGDGVSGAPTLSLPADVLIPTILTIPLNGLHLLDTNASHDLIIAVGSNLTADRTLTLTTGDGNRTIDISGLAGTLTISDAVRALLDDTSTGAMLTTLGAMPASYLDVDGTLAANSDVKVASQKAVKTYVDGLALNLGKRQRVRAATTANITISTALNNADVLDGVTLATGDLVLVKDQTAPAENGVYVVGAVPARDTQFDAWAEFPGSQVSVAEGSTNLDTLWLCTSNDGGTLGVTSIVFAKLTVAGELLGANNLSDVANAATAFGNIKQAATSSATGVVELATDAEAETGTDTVRALTPANGAATFVKNTLLTTRGDIITRGASAPQRVAMGAAGTVVASDGTDTIFRTLTALLDAVFGSTRGMMLVRQTSAWVALAKGTQYQALLGGAADLAWGAIDLAQATAVTGVLPEANLPDASTTAQGVAEIATAAEYRTGTDTGRVLSPAEVWAAGAEVTITYAGSVAPDFATFLNGVITLTGALVLANGSNLKPGQSGRIRLVQDGTGGRVLTVGTDYEWAGGTLGVLSTGASAQDVLYYDIIAAGRVLLSLVKNIS